MQATVMNLIKVRCNVHVHVLVMYVHTVYMQIKLACVILAMACCFKHGY